MENIVEKLHKNDMMWFFLVSLISSDTLLSVEDCETSLREITSLKKYLEESNLDEKIKEDYRRYIDDGIEIINRDMKIFMEEKSMETDG